MGELSWGAQLPELVCPAVGAGRQGQEVSVSLLLGGRPLLARHQGRGREAGAHGAERTRLPTAARLEAVGLLPRPAALNPVASARPAEPARPRRCAGSEHEQWAGTGL